MKKHLLLTLILSCLLVIFSTDAFSGDQTYYARCNLKVLKGKYITWVNWQSAPQTLSVGTKLKVSHLGTKAELTDEKTGKVYELDIGSTGEEYLAKFVSEKPVDTKRFSSMVMKNIKKGIAANGMTKEEVYIAMGPPATADNAKTFNMTYEEIMNTDLWVYARRRFGKNIGVGFDSDGMVDRTEGIWK